MSGLAGAGPMGQGAAMYSSRPRGGHPPDLESPRPRRGQERAATAALCRRAQKAASESSSSTSPPLRGRSGTREEDMARREIIIKDTHRGLWYEDGVFKK